MIKSYILIVVLFWMHCLSIAQDSTGVANDTTGIDAIKTRFVQKVGQFFDVRMLDHSIQTRGTVKKQGLKDSLKVFVDKTDGKLNVAIISSLNISEVWPNILNRKKYYSVDGKFALDSTFFNNPDSTIVKDAYIIGLEIDVDTLVTDREYGITITGDIDENISAFLIKKGYSTLEEDINQYFADYFAAHSGPWDSPNKAPVAEAIMGCLGLLDSKLSPYYKELMFAQSVTNLVSETFENANEKFCIKFKADSGQSYGFDWYQYLPWIKKYDFVRLGNGSIYNVNVKSTNKNYTGETVKAILFDSAAPIGFNINDISFKTKQGVPLNRVINGKEFKVTLPAYSSSGKEIIYAYHKEDKIGKLTVEVYKQKQDKVVIVPVNCDVALTGEQIENYLDMVYKRGVVDWDVQLDARWDNSSWDALTPGKLESADAKLMSKYSDEMRALRNVYFDSIGDLVVSKAYYLFVVPDFTSSTQLGYMVRGKSVGFIKNVPNTSSLKKTIVHELGHGAFGLKHNFDEIPKLSSDRLMDYSLMQSSTHLSKPEWDEIHSILPDWAIFDEEEEFYFSDAVLSSYDRIVFEWTWVQAESDDFSSFYTPGGMSIKLNDLSKISGKISFDPNTGGVSGFTYDGKSYVATHASRKGKGGTDYFYAYMRSGWREVFVQYLIPEDPFNNELFSERYDTLSMWNWLSQMEKHPEYFFSEYTEVGADDKVLSFFDSNKSCDLKVYSITGISTSEIIDSFDENDRFKSPLKGNFLSINTVIDKEENLTLTVLDEDTYMNLPNFTKEQEELFCEILDIYRDTLSWGKVYLERKVHSLGFNNPHQMLVKNPSAVKAIKEAIDIYDEMGFDLVNQYKTSFESQKFIALFQLAVEEALDNASDDQADIIKLIAHTALLKSFQERFKTKVKNLKSTSDEDLITDLIATSFSDAELKKLTKDTRIELIHCLVKDWMWAAEESAALRILGTAPDNESTYILDELMKPRQVMSWMVGNNSYYPNLFTALYSRVTGDENSQYVTVMYKLWYFSEKYSSYDNELYDYSNKPLVFDYKSESILGFYDSNHNLTRDDNFSKVMIQKEMPPSQLYSINPSAGVAMDFYVWLTTGEGDFPDGFEKYSYHPFQPIGIVNIDQEGAVSFPDGRIPAFLLYTFDHTSSNANTRFAIEIAIDVASTFIGGVGVLKAFKGGYKVFKGLSTTRKVVLGVKTVEFTAGATGVILKYACDHDNELCNQIKGVLTVIELASLSGDAIYGSIAKLKARKLLKQQAEIDKIKAGNRGDDLIEILIKTADDITGLLPNLKKAVVPSKLSEAKWADFVVDFGDDAYALTRFSDDLDLVNTWKKIKEANLPASLRKNPEVLERMKSFKCN